MQTSKDYIKARILKEATELFLSKGYLKVSMRQIAARAQVSLYSPGSPSRGRHRIS